MAGRLVGRSLEMGVAQPATPASSDHDGLVGGNQVGQQLAHCVVVDGRAGWHCQEEIAAGLAMTARARSPAARRGLEMMSVLEVTQRGLAGVDANVDRAAAAAIAAIGAPSWHVRLVAERGRAVAAATRTHADLDAVNEHQPDSRTARRSARMARNFRAKNERRGKATTGR